MIAQSNKTSATATPRKRQPEYRYEVDGLSSDPRLAGWIPCRRAHASNYTKLTITKMVERPPSSLFDRRDILIVHYSVNERDGGIKQRRTQFERKRVPNLGSMDAVVDYISAKTGRAAFEKSIEDTGLLSEVSSTLNSTQDIEIYKRIFFVERLRQQLKQWKPSGNGERLIRIRMRNCIKGLFELGMLAREIELRAAFEEDALRARRSAMGSVRGAKTSGKKRTEQANAWKRRFALWLQPLIDGEASRRKSGLSREKVADLVRAHWPKDGFIGSHDRQEQCPEWTTLINTLKILEKNKEIHRPPPKKGRKPRSQKRS